MPLALLTHEPTLCTNCPLFRKTRVPYCPTDVKHDGRRDDQQFTVDVLFLGESPSQEDDKMHMPFVGNSGKLLRSFAEEAAGGMTYAFGNAVRCRTVSSDGASRAPTDVEVNFCRSYSTKDIEFLKPKVVVLLGATAIKAMNPDPKLIPWVQGNVNAARAKQVTHKDVTYVATLHPSYCLKNPKTTASFQADIERAFKLARGEKDEYGEKGNTVLIDSVPAFEDLVHKLLSLSEIDAVAYDTETENLNRIGHNKLLSIQFAHDTETGYVVPLEHFQTPFSREQLDKHIYPGLTHLYTSDEAKFLYWMGHNLPFDEQKLQRFLGKRAIYLKGRPRLDTLFLMYLFDENRTDSTSVGEYGPFSLKTLAPELLAFYHYEGEAIEARNRGSLSAVPLGPFAEYGAMDGYVTYRLRNRITDMAKKFAPRMIKFALRWYSHVLRSTPEFERPGIYLHRPQLTKLKAEDGPIVIRMMDVLEELMQADEVKNANKALLKKDPRTSGMKQLFGKKEKQIFDINKKNSLIELFIDQLGLDVVERGKPTPQHPEGEPAIDKKFYAVYEKTYPSVALVKEYVGLKKLKTSYLNSFEEFLDTNPDMQDSRIRPQKLYTRTVTGREAQQKPSAHVFPRPEEDKKDEPKDKLKAKKEIKSLVCAARNRVLIETDFGQAEVRWWAQISGDREFAAAFERMKALRLDHYARPGDKELAERVKLECDIHRQVAALMFRVSIKEVTKPQRQAAKNLIFGSVYGQGIRALAQILQIEESEAEELQNKLINQFKHSAQWLQDIERFGETHHYVDTPMGRRRHLAPFFAIGQEYMRSSDRMLQKEGSRLIAEGRRLARNSPIQAQSSDTMTLSGCHILHHVIENNEPWETINLVHDANLGEIPLDADNIIRYLALVHDKMTNFQEEYRRDWNINMIVPFEVDSKIGIRWGHAETYEPYEDPNDLVKRLQEETIEVYGIAA